MPQTRANDHFADRVISRLKLRQLQLLVAVGQFRSILHAARQLNISQPAATKLIKELEADLGVALFERSNRGMIPTPFGTSLIRQGQVILSQIARAADEIGELRDGFSGRIAVGTLLAASANLLPRAVSMLVAERPGLMVHIHEGTNDHLMPMLRAGDLDLVVGRLSEQRYRADLVQEALFDERVICVARPSHPLHGLSHLALEQVLDFGWILPPGETTLRRQVDLMLLEAGHGAPRRTVQSVSYLFNRGLLALSDMVALVPEHAVETDLANGTLVELGWQVPLAAGAVGVSRRRDGEVGPAAEAFLTLLRRITRQARAPMLQAAE